MRLAPVLVCLALLVDSAAGAQDCPLRAGSEPGRIGAAACPPVADRLRREGLAAREDAPRSLTGTEIRIGGRVRGEVSGISSRR